MGKPAASIADRVARKGIIVTGAPSVYIGGRPAARVGDRHLCPHDGGVVLPPCAFNVLVCGRPLARISDRCSCGCGDDEAIVSGDPTVLVGTDPYSSDGELARMQHSSWRRQASSPEDRQLPPRQGGTGPGAAARAWWVDAALHDPDTARKRR